MHFAPVRGMTAISLQRLGQHGYLTQEASAILL
jgi:hypothetical protein